MMEAGALYNGNNNTCEFIVWSPFARHVELKLVSEESRTFSMRRDPKGYWTCIAQNIFPGDLYRYRLKNRELPDPASSFQPEGVHGPSQVVDHNTFIWSDAGWKGVPLSDMIMYELHVGTFTPEGTFDAVITRLDELKNAGINAIEIMPVAQFPGERNWGYDGVYIYAVHNSYGGPDGLKTLVNECHKKDIAVILDVVYNHLGPEGNCLREFGPYFTNRYNTPWGEAINFDGPYSNEVRKYFMNNALYWFGYFHIDALRIDAVHGIYDMSARHFLQELAETVEGYSLKNGRKFCLIAESDLNDVRIIQPRSLGGYGLDGHWCDDFHHSLHTLQTGEHDGYYMDFGRTEHLAKSLREGFVYSGQYSLFRKRNHGTSSENTPPGRFVVFAQNHDQTGNRLNGERLTSLVSFESLKLAAGMVLLSPYIPLLFMGEEYGETAPFLYFVSHSEENLINAVREGRKKEFASFHWGKEPPDPQSTETFQRSKLNWEDRYAGNGKILLEFYKTLITMRKEQPAVVNPGRKCIEVEFNEDTGIVRLKRWKDDNRLLVIFNMGQADAEFHPGLPMSGMRKILDSSEKAWKGPGTLLPGQPGSDRNLAIRKTSFAVYSGTAV